MAGLTAEERALLDEALAGRPDLAPLVRSLNAGDQLSVDEASVLRDAVGDEIGRSGIDNGAINERGVRLDHLMDRIGQISGMWSDPHNGCWCAELPDHFPGQTIHNDVRLASVLDAVGGDHSGGVAVYQCVVCGQRWIDRYDPDDSQRGVHRA